MPDEKQAKEPASYSMGEDANGYGSAAAAAAQPEGSGESVLTPSQQRAVKRAELAAKAFTVSTLLLLLLATSLYTAHTYLGWNQYRAAAGLFCGGLAGYPILQVFWFAYSSTNFRCWTGLSEHDRCDFVRKGPSLAHAIAMACVGAHILRVGQWERRDVVAGRDELVPAFLCLELAFLLQDLGAEVYKQLAVGWSCAVATWLRHVTLLVGLPWYYTQVNGDFFIACFFLLSASTVFTELQWFFQRCRVSGLARATNTLLLVLATLVCRVAIVPYAFAMYAQAQGKPLWEAVRGVRLEVVLAAVGMMLFNLAWLAWLLRSRRQRIALVRSSPSIKSM